MVSYHDLARKICCDLGIAWDDSSYTPMLRRIPLYSDIIDELFSSQEVQMSNSPLESAVVDRVCGTRGMELRSEWAASLQSNYFVGDANLRCA